MLSFEDRHTLDQRRLSLGCKLGSGTSWQYKVITCRLLGLCGAILLRLARCWFLLLPVSLRRERLRLSYVDMLPHLEALGVVKLFYGGAEETWFAKLGIRDTRGVGDLFGTQVVGILRRL